MPQITLNIIWSEGINIISRDDKVDQDFIVMNLKYQTKSLMYCQAIFVR